MDPETTTELLRRAREGSADALGTLLDMPALRLLALIRVRLGPRLRAEVESRDVLQGTLLRAIQGFERFAGQGRGSLMAWLCRIAENEIRDLAAYHGRARRDAARRVSLDDSEGRVGQLEARVRSQTSRLALSEDLTRLERALEALPSDHREVIVLRRLHELSFAEVAERMGRSADACRMLFARAMAALVLEMEASA